MDGLRFDAWTRRRFGLAASGIVASLVSLAGSHTVIAQKKKKKPCKQLRCKKEAQSCAPGNDAERCCLGLNCDRIKNQSGLRCCLGVQSRCVPGADLCCGDLVCMEVFETGIDRCCIPSGSPCSNDEDCCIGLCGASGECAFASDRGLKTNFASVAPAKMLEVVRDLPIGSWNESGDYSAMRHIGPRPQDFAAAFGVGGDDRHIHPIDGQGVVLAAIQSAAALVAELREEQARLAGRVRALEQIPNDRTR